MYWQVKGALEGSGYHILGIEHKPYREVYVISDADGNVFRCHSIYNKAGILRPFTSAHPGEVPDIILDLVNSGEMEVFPYSYTPSNQNLKDLFSKIQSACDENGITITNVVEHLNDYKVAYYLKTDAYFAFLDICVNKYGQVTYIAPRSEMGQDDKKLARLVEVLRK